MTQKQKFYRILIALLVIATQLLTGVVMVGAQDDASAPAVETEPILPEADASPIPASIEEITSASETALPDAEANASSVPVSTEETALEAETALPDAEADTSPVPINIEEVTSEPETVLTEAAADTIPMNTMAAPENVTAVGSGCVKSGSTVTCTGEDHNGFSGWNGLTVNVQEGAHVTNYDVPNLNPIRLGSDNTVTNYGNIEAIEGGDGVKANENNTVINYGIISADHHDAIDIFDGSTVINYGTLTTLEMTGDKAVEYADDLHLENYGTITAYADGIFTGSNSYIYNDEGQTIYSHTRDAIDGSNGVHVVNDGTISTALSGADAALEMGNSFYLENQGQVSADNEGVIAGMDARIENEGTIYSNSDDAVSVGYRSTIINDGSITTSTSTGNHGIDAGDDVNIQNNGLIEGRCRGIDAENYIVLNNYGTVRGYTCDGIQLMENGGTINNYGTISIGSSGSDAIDMNFGRVNNYGTISGHTSGIEVDGGLAGNSTIYNDGTITGRIGINAAADNNSNQQRVTNDGVITGTQGTAANLGAGNDTFEARVGSDANGIVNGGADFDIFTIGYIYRSGDTEAEQQYSTVQQAAATAPTTNCPCRINFTVLGITFDYTYINFEQIQSYARSSSTGGVSSQNATMMASTITTEEPLVEAPTPMVEIAPVSETNPAPVIIETALGINEMPSVEVAVPIAEAQPVYRSQGNWRAHLISRATTAIKKVF